jgi:hypothetical protein
MEHSAKSARDGRAIGAAAIGFAIALFTNMVLTDPPDMATAHSAGLAYYGDFGLRLKGLLAVYAAVVAASCFIALVVGEARRLERAGRVTTALVGAVGGSIFVTLYLVSAAIFAAPAFTLLFNNDWSIKFEPVPLTDDFALFAGAAGALGDIFLLFICGFGAAVFVGAVSIGERRASHRPRWLTAFGVVTAAALLSPLVFFSLLFLVAWAIMLGTYLIRHPHFASSDSSPGYDAGARAAAEV